MNIAATPDKPALPEVEPATAALAETESSHELTNRERFLRACKCREVDRPPVWLMRQAGRALPEYRALKERYSFLELVQTPELATEVTLQPIRRFDFDAAILFSDILVVAEALGQRYRFSDGGGISMEFLLETRDDVGRLQPNAVTERLQYVSRALKLIRAALGKRTALLGFAGSPWTLANYMIEGGGVREYTKAKALLYDDRALFDRLLGTLTRAVSEFLQLQIEAGVEAVQVFDSLGGSLSEGSFGAGSGQWLKRVVEAVGGRVPVIVFSRGAHGNWPDLVDTGAAVLGIDWNINLAKLSRALPKHVAVQGNLDPFVLKTTPQVVAAETNRLLRGMRGRPGHIFNLGHGVPPEAKIENLEALVRTVHAWPRGAAEPEAIS